MNRLHIFLSLTMALSALGQDYRPLYHLSGPGVTIGDPRGCIKYQNTYHLWTWDDARSTDLVYWSWHGFPMGTGPAGIEYFGGGVVVDQQNASGLGSGSTPPMVAVYSIVTNITLQEDIRISSSTDYNTDHMNFNYYNGNPVLVSDDKVFRDPDVFWDAERGRFFMTVVRSEAQNLHFYTSSDLKNWHYESDWGPFGARDAIWEAPGLVQVPVKGSPDKKWVLFTGVGPNKEQYFVGDFNGTTFTMDDACRNFLLYGDGLEGVLFANFEVATWPELGWQVTGIGGAFGDGPQFGSPRASGFLGGHLASSNRTGDEDYKVNSWLTSPEFTITKKCINFLIGGGNHPLPPSGDPSDMTGINLLVNGQVVRTATGQNSDILKWAGWNVADLTGQVARIQIVDDRGDFWGRIYVDHIMFSDTLMNFDRQHANWVDWGSDFYAARFFRDYDYAEQCAIWMGWMGNWDYATHFPTNSQAETLPRKVQLEWTPRGYQMVQQPLPRLQKLRGARVSVTPRRITGTLNLTQFQPQTNAYEMEVIFNLNGQNQNFGLNLCVGATDKTVLGYDASSSNVYLDRRSSGYVSFDPSFPNVVNAPCPSRTGYIKFHIYVDQSSIEVFVNDGQAVLTSHIFPGSASLGVQLFSSNGTATLRSLNAWELKSIWQ